MEIVFREDSVGADGIRNFLNRLFAGLGFAEKRQGRIQLLHLVLRRIREQVIAVRQAVALPVAIQRVGQGHGGYWFLEPRHHSYSLAIG